MINNVTNSSADEQSSGNLSAAAVLYIKGSHNKEETFLFHFSDRAWCPLFPPPRPQPPQQMEPSCGNISIWCRGTGESIPPHSPRRRTGGYILYSSTVEQGNICLAFPQERNRGIYPCVPPGEEQGDIFLAFPKERNRRMYAQ